MIHQIEFFQDGIDLWFAIFRDSGQYQVLTRAESKLTDVELGDPSQGIPAGTAFEDLPDDWVCPDCQGPKSSFFPFG